MPAWLWSQWKKKKGLNKLIQKHMEGQKTKSSQRKIEEPGQHGGTDKTHWRAVVIKTERWVKNWQKKNRQVGWWPRVESLETNPHEGSGPSFSRVLLLAISGTKVNCIWEQIIPRPHGQVSGSLVLHHGAYITHLISSHH